MSTSVRRILAMKTLHAWMLLLLNLVMHACALLGGKAPIRLMDQLAWVSQQISSPCCPDSFAQTLMRAPPIPVESRLTAQIFLLLRLATLAPVSRASKAMLVLMVQTAQVQPLSCSLISLILPRHRRLHRSHLRSRCVLRGRFASLSGIRVPVQCWVCELEWSLCR